MRRLAKASLLLIVFLLLNVNSASAADCQFILGFKTLRDLIGHEIVGDCLEKEYWNEIGDSNQQTTGGLMAWRKADNWTAFTDGYRTWINGPNGLVQRLNTDRFQWEADYAEIVLGIRPTPIPTPTPPPAPTGSTINDPIVSNGILVTPRGKALFAIALSIPDAWPWVYKSNRFNDPPQSGSRYFIVGVTVENVGDTAIRTTETDFRLVGDKRVLYSTFQHGCGVVDEELNVELFPSGIGSGLICFQVPKDEGGFVLVFEQFLAGTQRRYIRVPEGCPNNISTTPQLAICQNDINTNFDISPQRRALGLPD